MCPRHIYFPLISPSRKTPYACSVRVHGIHKNNKESVLYNVHDMAMRSVSCPVVTRNKARGIRGHKEGTMVGRVVCLALDLTHAVVDHGATAPAVHLAVEQTESDAEREPQDRSQNAWGRAAGTSQSAACATLGRLGRGGGEHSPRRPYLVVVTCPPSWRQSIWGWSGGRRDTTRSPVAGFT